MPTRRLAAIMFTDIEGYTRLMEEDESHANIIRKRHRDVFERFHQQHHGDIIQYFGDGTLSVFDSCVEAVKCAVAMQEAFQAEPKVPLRVGIHLGDIEYSKTEVAGHGVNVASRVESLGVSGAVLISDAVNQQIQNHGFESMSMGTFDMKNVSRNMEVFAVQTKTKTLVIPNPKDLKGKGKRLDSALKTRQLIKLASIGFFAMLLGAALFWASGSREQSQLLPESIREEKVAVSVFDNFTDDESLNTLGYLASEWIGSGLRELKVRTVSPEMVRQNKETIGILPDNPQGKPSFAEITGAKYVVAGSYFLEGDSILLKTRLSSTETGEDIRAFPTIRGHKDQREKLVEEARQYLLGYWVLKRDQKLPIINPPKYEAYKQYLKCFPSDYSCLQMTLEIDPDFLLVRAYLMGAAVSWNFDSIYWDSKKILEQRWDQCAEFEKNIFREAAFMWDGNYEAAFKAYDANYQLDPEDYIVLHQSAYLASAGLNRPDIAVERYEKLFNRIDIYQDQIQSSSFQHYLDALIRQKEYKKVTDFYFSLSDEMKKRAGALKDVIVALIYQNRIEETQKLIIKSASSGYYALWATYTYAYIYPEALTNPFAESLRRQLDDFNDPGDGWNYKAILPNYNIYDSRAFAYYILKEWDKAEKIILGLRGMDWEAYYAGTFVHTKRNTVVPHVHTTWVEAMLGHIYAQQGKREAALQQIEIIRERGKLYHSEYHSPFWKGMVPYWVARIYAILGEKEKAVSHLEEARGDGLMYIWWSYTLDLDLVNLKGYPPFEVLVAPDH